MTLSSKTKVAIVGSGPAGLLLSHLLHLQGVDSIVLERKSQDYVLSRIRAGVLERGTVKVLRDSGLGERMDREGLLHDGIRLGYAGGIAGLDFNDLIGDKIMVYGQTEVTKDLMKARAQAGGTLIYEAQNVAIHDYHGDTPSVTYEKEGVVHEIKCDFIAGCDGFHGVCRKSIPAGNLEIFERIYPFGWLGILTETPPVHEELIYANHERGFALASMRSDYISRYYLQTPMDIDLADWPDERIWEELSIRLGGEVTRDMVTGPSIEKSLAPLRSFVAEPLRHGRLFLAGDAAHIVPPTGAKGLNLAVADIRVLSQALVSWFHTGDDQDLNQYSDKALRRIWKAERFSWFMTRLLHTFPEEGGFAHRIQQAELDYIIKSRAAAVSLAENYVGLTDALI